MNQAQAWKQRGQEIAAEVAVDLLLPSGITIRARRPSPSMVASWGRLPMILAGAVLQRSEASAEISDTEVLQASEFLRNVLTFACVSPRLSVKPGPEEIHPKDIPEVDLDFIIAWAMRGDEAKSLESFRGFYGVRGAGGDGSDVRATAVDAVGDRRADGGFGDGSGGGRGVAETPAADQG